MTSNPHRMKENLGSIEFIMDKKDLDAIDSLNKNQRYGQSGNWNVYDNQNGNTYRIRRHGLPYQQPEHGEDFRNCHRTASGLHHQVQGRP